MRNVNLESKLLTPLGGASLDGVLFEITNKSRNAVYVNGALYEPDTVCLTIEVKDGVAQSDVRALPYWSWYGFGGRVECVRPTLDFVQVAEFDGVRSAKPRKLFNSHCNL